MRILHRETTNGSSEAAIKIGLAEIWSIRHFPFFIAGHAHREMPPASRFCIDTVKTNDANRQYEGTVDVVGYGAYPCGDN